MPSSLLITIKAAQKESAIAFDYGQRRIGLALWEPVTRTAAPLATVKATPTGPDWPEIQRHIQQWQPSTLVVGIPHNSDGSAQTMTAHAQRFGRQLEGRFGIPVEMVDERYSSQEAHHELRELRRKGIRNRRLKKEDIDQQAARIILERWYDLRCERKETES